MKLKKLMLIALISTMTLLINARVKEIKSEDEVQPSDKHKVVKFHALWCPSCVGFKDKFEELSEEYPEIEFYSVNTDEARDLASKHKVSALPSILVFEAGKDEPQNTVIGGNKDRVKEAIKSLKTSSTKPAERTERKEEKVETKDEAPSMQTVTPGKVVEVKKKEQFDSLVNSGKSVVFELVKETCHFCKEIRPTLDELARAHSDAVIAIVDKDDVPEVIEKHSEHVRGYPTFVIYKNGKLEHAFTGATERSLKPRISACLGKSDMQFVAVDDKSLEKATGNGSAVSTSETPVSTKSKAKSKSKFGFGKKSKTSKRAMAQ